MTWNKEKYPTFREYMLSMGPFKPCPGCGNDGWDNCPECSDKKKEE